MSGARFRGDIEGLRGLAVALVVAEHIWGVPTGGFIGVDVFFVVSGYVITAGLLREHAATGTISFRAFSERRVRRLLPAALVTIVVTVVVARVVFYTPRFLQVAWDAAASMTSVQNWRLIRQGTDYFSAGQASPLQHFWSLSVEEQFYVFWPLLLLVVLLVARRAGIGPRRALAVVVVAAVILSFAASVAESAFRPGWSYFSLESRVWELGVGALLAILAPRMLTVPAGIRRALFVLGVLAIVGSAFAFDGSLPFPGPWALVPVAGTAAVIVAGERRDESWAVVLTAPPTRYLGRVSYSLYLWHFPAVVFSATLVWWSGPLAAIAALVASLVLADLSVRFVERPFRRSRRQSRSGRWSGGWSRRRELALAVTVVVAVSGVVGVQLKGPAWLVDVPDLGASVTATAAVFPDDGAVAEAVVDATAVTAWPTGDRGPDGLWPSTGAAQRMSAEGCLVDARTAAAGLDAMAASCRFEGVDAERTAVVVGDSIAISWLPSVVDALVPLGWAVVGIGVQSCPAVVVDSAERVGRAEFTALCDAARENAFRAVERISPDLVVTSSALGSFERLSSGATGDAAMAEWQAGLEETIAELSVSTRSIVVLSSPPETRAVGQCASPLLSPASCADEVSSEWVEKDAAEEAAVRAAAADGAPVDVVPVLDWFCTEDGVCPAVVDGTIVTVDGGHLSESYAESLALVVRQSLQHALGPAGRGAPGTP